MSAARNRAVPPAVALVVDDDQPTEFRALDACHQQIAGHLTLFAKLVDTLASEGVTPVARRLARTVEGFFSSTAQAHHVDEERRVFPPLLDGGDAEVVAAVRRLQQDHGFIEENWIELAPQLRALAEGYAWYDPDLLREGSRLFIDLLEDHIALEESLIYPQAKAMWVQLLAQRARRQAEIAASDPAA